MVTWLLVIAVVVAVLVGVMFVVGYNKVRSADVRVDEALGGIDVQLTRRASLIPALVQTVKSFASHERGIIENVTNARAAITSATQSKSVAARSSADKQLDTAVGQVLALGNIYPTLTSSANFLDLQRNLADTEDKLAFARQYYNDAVATCNKAVTTIPWMFVSGLAGVKEHEYYKVPQ
jgi:LemA protein